MNSSGYYVNQSNGYNYTIRAGILTAGSHTIKAAAIDAGGNVSWQTRTITVGSPQICVDSTQGATYSGDVSVNGWAVNASGVSRIDAYLDLNGNSSSGFYSVPSSQFSQRTDVQKAVYPNGNYPTGANCGYTITVPASDLTSGQHTLSIASIANDGSVQWVTYQFNSSLSLPSVVVTSSNTWSPTGQITVATANGFVVDSEKYVLGSVTASYFSSHGITFTGNQVSVPSDGVYTVYVHFSSGITEIKTVTVSNVYSAVNYASYQQSFTDMTVPSVGINTTFARRYESYKYPSGQYYNDNLLGIGWTFSYTGWVQSYQYAGVDSNGNPQYYNLDAVKIVRLPDGSTSTYQMVNNTYTSYDTRNTLTQNSDGTYTVVTPGKLHYLFNSQGYLTAISDKNGNTEKITVDSSGKVQSVTDTAGRGYKIGYTTNGLISSITDPIGRTVTYQYNDGELTTVTDSMGASTQYAYSGNQLIKITDPLSNVEASISYDAGGRVSSVTDATGKTSNYVYGSSANTITITGSDGKSTIDSYNSLDVITKETASDGTVTTINQYGEPTASGGKTYTYDSNGNLLQTAYSDGTTDVCTYDANGNLSSEKDQSGKKTFYEYDANGDMTKKAVQNDGTSINYTDSGDQTLFAITTYAYNSNGSLKTEADSDSTVTTNTYDSAGDVLTQSSVKGTTTTTVTNTYNAIGWVTQSINASKDTSNGSNTSTTTTYVYDKDGQTVRQTNGADVTRYVFDGAGRLIQKINPDEYIASKDGLNKSTPDYSYADSTVGYKYAYTGGSTVASSETMPNGEVLTYNDSGVVTSVHNPANGAAASNMSYTYDDNNNIQTISENGAQKVAYTYDSSNQLTRENNVWQNETITYTYDSNGNILTKIVYPYTAGDLTSVTAIHTYTYTYGNSSDVNQLTSYDGKPITYDASGDVTNYNGWTYTWANGNLSGSSSTGNTISYQYNADGIRTSKTVNGKTTSYTINGSEIKSQSDGTNTISFAYDDQGSPLTMTLNGVKYNYEKNAQGDVTGLIDSNGNEVVTYQYDSWGKLLSIGGSLKDNVGLQNPLRYRGYYYDAETGLYYLQSRYYIPEWGRFISKDGEQYHDGESGVGANLYAYSNNNPVNYSDSSGHWIESIIIGIASGVIIYIASLIGIYGRRWTQHFSARDYAYAAITGALWGALGPFYGCLPRILTPLGVVLAKTLGFSVASTVTFWVSYVIYHHRR